MCFSRKRRTSRWMSAAHSGCGFGSGRSLCSLYSFLHWVVADQHEYWIPAEQRSGVLTEPSRAVIGPEPLQITCLCSNCLHKMLSGAQGYRVLMCLCMVVLGVWVHCCLGGLRQPCPSRRLGPLLALQLTWALLSSLWLQFQCQQNSTELGASLWTFLLVFSS